MLTEIHVPLVLFACFIRMPWDLTSIAHEVSAVLASDVWIVVVDNVDRSATARSEAVAEVGVFRHDGSAESFVVPGTCCKLHIWRGWGVGCLRLEYFWRSQAFDLLKCKGSLAIEMRASYVIEIVFSHLCRDMLCGAVFADGELMLALLEELYRKIAQVLKATINRLLVFIV